MGTWWLSWRRGELNKSHSQADESAGLPGGREASLGQEQDGSGTFRPAGTLHPS